MRKKRELPPPGSVWWCDGISLSFESHFKRRPVLVLGVRREEAAGEEGEPEVVVAPLSSKRRHGQEQVVTHSGGVSYLTGAICVVAPEALLSSLGEWAGFAAWSTEQHTPPVTGGLAGIARALWEGLLSRLRRHG